jgi:hypothetical protein
MDRIAFSSDFAARVTRRRASRRRFALRYSRGNAVHRMPVEIVAAHDSATEVVEMNKNLVTVFAALMVSVSGMSAQAQASGEAAGRWRGHMLRNGLEVPIEVTLAERDAGSIGRLRVGSSVRDLENVRVAQGGVHFELPGEGAFDGSVAGDTMAGSVSGAPTPGGFALTREPEPMFADPITSSGP